MKKVCICTKLPSNKPHPRIEKEKELYEKHGYTCEILYYNDKKNNRFIHKILYLITFSIFRFDAISYFKLKINNYDIIHVYDLALLPLCKFAKNNHKKVIYETIDDNVSFSMYEFSKLISLPKSAQKILIKVFRIVEYNLSNQFADFIIVNSKNLLSLFNKSKTHLLFYTSPFETITNPLNQKDIVLLYLGKFTIDKGALETINLSKEYNLKLFIIGELKVSIENTNSLIEHLGNYSGISLIKLVESLIKKYKLIGVSIIHSVHDSYKYQEANKDIDYIAMQVPIIGNKRPPTLEKLNLGCGVEIDSILVKKLIFESDYYNKCSLNCKKIYENEYSNNIFEEKFNLILNEI